MSFITIINYDNWNCKNIKFLLFEMLQKNNNKVKTIGYLIVSCMRVV